MNFLLNNEQELLRKTIREFSQKEIAPVAKELSYSEQFSTQIIDKMVDVGLFGMFVAEEYYGLNMDYLSYCVAVEEISRIDCSHGVTVASANSYGIGPISEFGSASQKEQWLPDLCNGRILGSFGFTRSAEKESSSVHAELENNAWIINGINKATINASSKLTGLCIIQVATGIKKNHVNNTSCLLVPKETSGFSANTIRNKLAWRAANIGKITFDQCKVPEVNLLGKKGEGAQQVTQIQTDGSLAFAAVALGGAQGAYEQGLKYAKQRILHGRPLASFHANSTKLVKMATGIEAGRNLLYKACMQKDAGKQYAKEALMAHVFCTELMGQVADSSVQLHGGSGLMNEYDIERFFRDYKGLTIGQQSQESRVDLISKEIGVC